MSNDTTNADYIYFNQIDAVNINLHDCSDHSALKEQLLLQLKLLQLGQDHYTTALRAHQELVSNAEYKRALLEGSRHPINHMIRMEQLRTYIESYRSNVIEYQENLNRIEASITEIQEGIQKIDGQDFACQIEGIDTEQYDNRQYDFETKSSLLISRLQTWLQEVRQQIDAAADQVDEGDENARNAAKIDVSVFIDILGKLPVVGETIDTSMKVVKILTEAAKSIPNGSSGASFTDFREQWETNLLAEFKKVTSNAATGLFQIFLSDLKKKYTLGDGSIDHAQLFQQFNQEIDQFVDSSLPYPTAVRAAMVEAFISGQSGQGHFGEYHSNHYVVRVIIQDNYIFRESHFKLQQLQLVEASAGVLEEFKTTHGNKSILELNEEIVLQVAIKSKPSLGVNPFAMLFKRVDGTWRIMREEGHPPDYNIEAILQSFEGYLSISRLS